MRYKRFINLIFAVLIVIAVFLTSACENGTTKAPYLIYYTDSDADNLISREVSLSRQDLSDLEFANTLIFEMSNPDIQGEDNLYSVFPEGLGIASIDIDDAGTILLDFNSVYKDMSNVREIIFRAAVVLTLVQINGIEGVEFFIEGEPLADYSGSQIGVMNSDTFVNVLY